MSRASSPLLTAHVIGDNTLAVLDTTVFSPVFPFNVAAEEVSTQKRTVFTVTGVSSGAFVVTPAPGFTDIALDAETSIDEVTESEQLKVLQQLTLIALDSYGRPISTGSAPTVAAGAAAGTSPTIAIAAGSNDVVGKLNLTPAATTANSGIIATVTFNKPWAVAPKNVIVTPGNAAAAAAMAFLFISSITTTTFVITATGTALTATTAYIFNFQVQG